MTTPHTTGTITLTNGSTAVTGTGTGWVTALITGGTIYPDVATGNALPIASVNSNTSITAALPWRGATGTYGYALMRDTTYGEQSVSNADALASVLDALRSNSVTALSALASAMAADKLPYAVSGTAMAMTTLTAFARTLLDDTNLAAALVTLGPVFGGTAPLPSAAGVGLADGDFNTIVVAGVYNIAGTWNNTPSGDAVSIAGTLEVVARATAYFTQILRMTNGRVYRRRGTSTTSWAAWEIIELPAVGTVSQSSGVPTGAIMERGSNANGEYIRFADGTQICWLRESALPVAITAASGALYRDTTIAAWTFPAAFSVTPIPYFSVTSSFIWGVTGGASTTVMTRTAMATATFSGSTVGYNLAVGRWF